MGARTEKRILLVGETLSPGGAERQIVSDANLLAANGWNVTLAYWAGGILEHGLTQEVTKYLMKAKSWPGRLLDLYHFCCRSRFDLIHAHLTVGNLLASLVGKLLRIPVIVTEHGLGLWRLEEPKFRLAVFLTYKFASRIVAVSEATRKAKIENDGADPQKTLVLYNCYNPSAVTQLVDRLSIRSGYQIPLDAFVVGFVGSLTTVKRPDLLVTIASRVVKEVPCTIFLVVGDGPYRSQLQDLINDKHLEASFRLVGSQAAVAQFYGGMDVFVLTSERETFSIASLEAAASGLPVVAFDVGGISEVVVHDRTGFLVPFADCDQFAAYLIHLLKDNDLRKRIGNDARQRAEAEFSPAVRLEALQKLYADVLTESRR